MFPPKISITRLSHFVIGYMILAFGWWSFHLWQQNERLFAAEKKILELQFSAEAKGLNITQFEQTREYGKIRKAWGSRRRMVIAEGLFFVLCLAFGLWVINRSANKEVSLARQRRNFLLSITHELKSPIASIRLALETLQKRVLTDEQKNQLLKNGIKDADRLQYLVEDLLLAARLEDKWQPVPEPLNLYEIARECSEGLKLRFPDIFFEIHCTVPILVADKLGIQAVVKNLLENAAKYAPPHSTVNITISNSGGRFVLIVSDQGAGVPDAEKSRIFEKFYRLGHEETRKTTGTGLGLFIVQQVVMAHHGTIKVSDNQPHGAVFTVTF